MQYFFLGALSAILGLAIHYQMDDVRRCQDMGRVLQSYTVCFQMPKCIVGPDDLEVFRLTSQSFHDRKCPQVLTEN